MTMYDEFHKRVLDDAASGKRVSPLTAIRAFCLECVGFNHAEVSKCKSKDCPLWYFRMKRNDTGQKKAQEG